MGRRKLPPDPRVRQFVDYAYEMYSKRYNAKMLVTVIDTTQIKRLLANVNDLDQLKKLWDFYFWYKGQDWQLQKSTKDIRCFVSLYNRIVQIYGAQRTDPGYSGDLSGCRVIDDVLKARFAAEYNLQIQARDYIKKLPANIREEKLKNIEAELLHDVPISKTWAPATLRQTAESHLHDRCADWLRKKKEAATT